MASYHFPIILGRNKKERIVIIHLTDGAEDYQENRVVVVSSSQNEPLFRIPKEANMVNPDGSIADIVATTGGNLTIEDSSINETIAPTEKDDFYRYTIKNNVDYGFDGIIKFRYTKSETEYYEGCLNIIRTEDRNVLKINIDLGSEATQATFFYQNKAAKSINLVEAIKETYSQRDYGTLIKPTSGTLFTQQDEDNKYYYKTGNITFHKYSNNSDCGDLTLNEQPESDQEITEGKTTYRPFINYLNVAAAGKNANSSRDSVWSKEKPYTEKLFNIKVLYANTTGLGPLCEVKWRNHNDSIENSVDQPDDITRVLRVIYKQIITAAEKRLKCDDKYKKIKATSVLVLVPNIYKQEDIDELLYELNQLNNSAINNPENREMRYDFRVISESDAAFLGVKTVGINGNGTILKKINDEVDDEKQKDAYLIIDSGKGTTDFSIINYNPGDENSVFSCKRGGIAGAGGAIDYVFARIVARQIYKNSEKDKDSKCDETVFVNRFMEVITKLHPTRQDKAMRLIELAKKEYDVDNGKIPIVCNCFPDAISNKIMEKSEGFNIDTILSLTEWNNFENNDWDKTSFTPVEKTDTDEIISVCNKIAKETIDVIFGKNDEHKHITNRIDVVIMTGRSFLFKPLRLAFEEMLNEKKGIFSVNFSSYWAFWRAKKRNERANLKIDDTTLSLNMKEVSVKFSERDLGYNCNSDLCCLDSLELINDDQKIDFKQDMFWKGFTYNDDDGSKDYYIGYMDQSFAFHRRRDTTGDGITDLVNMTLFPNHYEPDVNL